MSTQTITHTVLGVIAISNIRYVTASTYQRRPTTLEGIIANARTKQGQLYSIRLTERGTSYVKGLTVGQLNAALDNGNVHLIEESQNWAYLCDDTLYAELMPNDGDRFPQVCPEYTIDEMAKVDCREAFAADLMDDDAYYVSLGYTSCCK